MSDNISMAGIEKAVSALEYRNSRSHKYRLIHAIKQFHDSDQFLQAIDPDELVPLVWDHVIQPGQLKSKRKNLNSIRSSINADLMKCFKDGKNPEGIIIGPSHVFSMCDEAKDAILKSFTSALASDEPITLDNISEVTRLFGEFLNKVSDDNSLEFVGSILDALSSKKPLPIEKAAEVLGMFDNLITNMPDNQILKENDTVSALLDKLADKAGWTPPDKSDDDSQSEDLGSGIGGIESLSLEEIAKLDSISEEELEKVELLDNPEGEIEYIEPEEPNKDSQKVEVVEVVVEDEAKGESEKGSETGEKKALPELDELEEVEDDELEDSEEEEQLGDEEFEDVESIDDEEGAGEGEGENEDESEKESEIVEVLDVVLEDEAKEAKDDPESGEDEDVSELDELEEVEDDELEDSEEEEQLGDEEFEDDESIDDEEGAGEGEGENEDESEKESEIVEVLDVVLEDEAKNGAKDDPESGEDEDVSELDELEEVEDDELEDSEEEEQLNEEELEEVEELDNHEEESFSESESDDSELDPDVVEVLDVVVEDEDAIAEVEASDDDIEEVDEESEEGGSSADYEGKYDIDEDEFDLEELSKTERKRILAERFDRYLGAMERHFNQFLLIPSGEYTIGTKEPTPGELPVQKIQVNDFFMGKYPVINALFEVFVERTGYTTTAEKKGFGIVYEGRFRKIKDERTGQYRFVWNATHNWKEVKSACWYQPTGPGSTLHQKRNHPVVQVSLLDAMAFASWVGKRLPTDAEWEAAARTDKGYRFPWGDDWKDGLCNTETSEFADTTSVDHYPDAVNKMGIADLVGNTLEWTSEKCDPPNNSRNDFDYHFAKGGSWVSEENIQLASRYRFPTDFTSNTLGFRCLAD